MKLDQIRIRKFQKEILDWYTKNKRDLPWRHPSLELRNGKTRDPYTILVSEVMLQQTQVQRVIPKFEAWMKRFPTIQLLAKASARDVLLYWSGLGYNRRALYLKKAAETLVNRRPYVILEQVKRSDKILSKRKKILSVGYASFQDDNIEWPQTEEELRKLPGIGEYTARALLCFAFDKQVAVVDTNIRKVILLKFLNRHPEFISGSQLGRKKKEERSKKEVLKQAMPAGRQVQHDKKIIQEIADELLPQGKAYEWNQALMDYSALVLSKEKSQTFLRQGYRRAGQSRFKDSDRYYRGQILKILLNKKRVSRKELARALGHIEEKRLEKIIASLKKDTFLEERKEILMLLSR